MCIHQWCLSGNVSNKLSAHKKKCNLRHRPAGVAECVLIADFGKTPPDEGCLSMILDQNGHICCKDKWRRKQIHLVFIGWRTQRCYMCPESRTRPYQIYNCIRVNHKFDFSQTCLLHTVAHASGILKKFLDARCPVLRKDWKKGSSYYLRNWVVRNLLFWWCVKSDQVSR